MIPKERDYWQDQLGGTVGYRLADEPRDGPFDMSKDLEATIAHYTQSHGGGFISCVVDWPQCQRLHQFMLEEGTEAGFPGWYERTMGVRLDPDSKLPCFKVAEVYNPDALSWIKGER